MTQVTGRTVGRVGAAANLALSRAFGTLAAVATTMLMAASAAAATGPQLSLNPGSGVPGDTVAATGVGFCPPPCSAAEIDFAGVNVATGAAVTADGSLGPVTFRVPSGVDAGSNSVVAIQRDAEGRTVYTFATYTITSKTGTPGPTDSVGPGPNNTAGPSSSGRPGAPTARGSSAGAGIQSPPVTVSPDPAGGGRGRSGFPTGLVLGIVAGALVLAVAAGALVMRKRP
jgi:hypothetical protein